MINVTITHGHPTGDTDEWLDERGTLDEKLTLALNNTAPDEYATDQRVLTALQDMYPGCELTGMYGEAPAFVSLAQQDHALDSDLNYLFVRVTLPDDDDDPFGGSPLLVRLGTGYHLDRMRYVEVWLLDKITDDTEAFDTGRLYLAHGDDVGCTHTYTYEAGDGWLRDDNGNWQHVRWNDCLTNDEDGINCPACGYGLEVMM